MKGFLSLWAFVLLFSITGFGQDVNVEGTVKDENGSPVPAASVEVKPEDTGTFTDSTGFFRISVKPNSVIIVSAAGFGEETVRVKGNSLIVVLKPKAKSLQGITVIGNSPKNDAPQTVNSQLVQGNLQEFSSSMGAHFSHSGIAAFSLKEETKGSRYLFTGGWARGKVVTMSNSLTDNPHLSFNYDKMNHNLFITEDMRKVLEVEKEQVRAFDLRIDGKEYNFKRISAIDSNQFVQVLSEEPGKYAFYKLTKTRFVKSNYHSDGMVESGNPYDEYVDEYYYFLVPPDGKSYKLITVLKTKALKELLRSDNPRAMAYISQHKYDPVDEPFLLGMVEYINQ